MDHSEVHVEHADLPNGECPKTGQIRVTYQLRVGVDDLLNTLPCECFLTEAPLDVVENFSVGCISLVQYISKL